MNNIVLRNATHDDAIAALKNTEQVLELTVLRDLSQFANDGWLLLYLIKNLLLALLTSLTSTWDIPRVVDTLCSGGTSNIQLC